MAENDQTKTCSKCGKQMEKGYIPDRGYAKIYFPIWVSGPPEKSFLAGLNIDGKNPLNITTFRCFICGYLESYAQE
jgi:hypothetical protein